MVCERCIQAVRSTLQELKIPVTHITLGEVTTIAALSAPDMAVLGERLATLGFSLLENRQTKLVQEVKELVEKVYAGDYDFPAGFKFSDIVVHRLHRDYNTVSNIFSGVEGLTLERYIMEYRMEKVKELLVYTNDTLADIAFKLGFSSAAHLSRQFKTQTGLNTSHFKDIRKSKLYTIQHK